MRALVFIAVLSWGIHASLVEAKELWERPWIEVASPSFRVLSMLDEARTRDLIVDLEHFRRAVEMFTNIERFDAPIPTKVFVLARPERELGLERGIQGYFLPQMRQNVAVVGAPGDAQDTILKHEYVHFLLHNQDRQVYPPWFDEGFAEFLSTLTVEDGVVTFGRSSEMRATWLAAAKWRPYAKLLEVRDVQALGQAEMNMFYAQSWLLVHYLNFGGTTPDLATRQGEFLRLWERGTKPADAFERAFGHDVDRLRMVLKEYARELPYHQLRPNTPFPEVPVTVHPVRSADIATELGWLVFSRGMAPERAQRYFDAALAIDPNHAGAMVGLGDVLKVAGRFDEAQSRYERAIALDTDNPTFELDFGEFFLERAAATEDPQQKATLLVEARRHFARSHTIAPNNPETLAMNGSSYLMGDVDPAKAVASLESAHELLPAQVDIRVLLGQAYLAAGEIALAREQFEIFVAWGGAENAEEVRAWLASLGEEKREEPAIDSASPQ